MARSHVTSAADQFALRREEGCSAVASVAIRSAAERAARASADALRALGPYELPIAVRRAELAFIARHPSGLHALREALAAAGVRP